MTGRYTDARRIYDAVKRDGDRVLTLPEIQRVIDAHEAASSSPPAGPVWTDAATTPRVVAALRRRWPAAVELAELGGLLAYAVAAGVVGNVVLWIAGTDKGDR